MVLISQYCWKCTKLVLLNYIISSTIFVIESTFTKFFHWLLPQKETIYSMKGIATLFLLVVVLNSQYVNAKTQYSVYYLKDFVEVNIFLI